jgi:hypothetical protein
MDLRGNGDARLAQSPQMCAHDRQSIPICVEN